MEKITVTKEVTMADVAQRIEYFTNRASEIHDLMSKDQNQARQEFTLLRRELNHEYHELALAKNTKVIGRNIALWAYRNYFGHLHFTGNYKKNLAWNLGEFSQGKRWFDLFVKECDE